MAEESAQLKRPGSIARAIAPALLLIATLSGCVPPDLGKRPAEPKTPVPATRPAPAPAPAPAPEPEPPVTPPPAPPPAPVRVIPPVGAASQALLNESRSHAAAGRYPQAAASIERAIRIEPRQPVLWLELGNIRLKEGNLAQAESLGRKALSLSAGDAELSARAQQLITAAKKR
jgi:tetratricopeptide (TPR) repeat protein